MTSEEVLKKYLGTEREGLLPSVVIPCGGVLQKTDSHHYVGMAISIPYSLKPAV
jgi:hypothetical protein